MRGGLGGGGDCGKNLCWLWKQGGLSEIGVLAFRCKAEGRICVSLRRYEHGVGIPVSDEQCQHEQRYWRMIEPHRLE